jgi:hypothetical protein
MFTRAGTDFGNLASQGEVAILAAIPVLWGS